MVSEMETQLARELRQVAEGVRVPELPAALEAAPLRSGRRWQPLAVAAIVALIVSGAVGLAFVLRGANDPGPATPTLPPAPSPSQSQSPEPVPLPTLPPPPKTVAVPPGAPKVPYVLDSRLYLNGQRQEGRWTDVTNRGKSWLAERSSDGTYWWGGPGLVPTQTPPVLAIDPSLSPNGEYLATAEYVGQDLATTNGYGQGEVTLRAYSTSSGEQIGSIVLPEPPDGSGILGLTVTNDGGVIILDSPMSNRLWRINSDKVVDLTGAQGGLVIDDVLPGGLFATDGNGDPVRVAVSAQGVLRVLGTVPGGVRQLVLAPDGASASWVDWDEIGTAPRALDPGFGHDALKFGSLTDMGTARAVRPPDGWLFELSGVDFEDDDHLVASVINDSKDQRIARCSTTTGECELIPAG